MVNNDFNKIINNGMLQVNLINYVFNMWDENWYNKIINYNSNSIINKIAEKDGLEDLFLEVLIRNSKLIFEKISFISFCFSNKESRRFHSSGSFNPGDKYFYIFGYSPLVKDTLVELEIVFSGDLYA